MQSSEEKPQKTGSSLPQRARRDKAQTLQDAFDALSDAVSVIDLTGRILQTNRAMARLLGRSVEQTLGRHCWELVHNRSNPIEGCPVLRMQASHRKESTLIPVRDRLWHVSVDPIRNGNGEPTAAVHVISDVTEQKRREEESFQTRKLESIQTLAGGLAHEFNNVMMIIWGNVDLARMYAPADARVVRCLEHASRACQRAKHLSRQLLTISRGGSMEKRHTDIAGLVRVAASATLRGSPVRSTFDLPADLWAVEADREQIAQALRSLIENASESMEGKGPVRITARNQELPEENEASLKPGRYVRVEVRDRGPGIPEEHQPRIFDPYFSTKENRPGLGLSLAQSILHKHGGTIRATSAPGLGSTFSFWLPAAPVEGLGAEPPGLLRAPRGMNILFMDDEDLVREMVRQMLLHLGHRVELCRDGAEAVRRVRASLETGRRYDLFILDLTVPGGMGGKEALERIRELDPGARAIISSGYSEDPIMADCRRHGFLDVIPKPYTLESLRETLNRCLLPGSRPGDPG